MSYLNVDEVATATVNLAATYSSITQLLTLPNVTAEGRTSHALRLGGGTTGSRDVFVMTFGIHAREWGSCEIALNFATDVLEAFSTNQGLTYGGMSFTAAQIQTLLTTLHIVVFPLVNPDGRHYSQTADSMWRKNRNPAYANGNPACYGVDLNRNFDFLFDFASEFAPGVNASASTNPCEYQVYHGPFPFSEAETQNVRWLLDNFSRTQWFVDVHSYSQDILYNWGDDQNQSTDPTMTFLNPAFNGQRGKSGDDYGEYIHGDDLIVVQVLANRFVIDLQAVRGKIYTAKSSYALYPTCGTSDDYAYSRHIVDPSKSKVFGFTVEWGLVFQPAWAEMEEIIKDVTAGLLGMCTSAPCADGSTAVGLLTPTISFNNVAEGVTTTRAAVFSVQSCRAVSLNVTAGPSVVSGPGAFGLPLGGSESLPMASGAQERDGRIWISYTGTNAGDHVTGSMQVTCPQSNQVFTIPIAANTIAPPTTATCLILDQSGSMDSPSGIPGKRRIDVLHDAAPNFVSLMSDHDGIGIVSFDQTAYLRMGVTQAGPMGGGAGRALAMSAIANHVTDLAGTTSIGNGVEMGHNAITATSGYDSTALVVFTDGEENTAKFIANVQSLVDNRVFAVGLGTVAQINPVALNHLVANTGGYLLLTDDLGASDVFKLQKYFVQILASATNAEVVVDPDGYLPPNTEIKIPFSITEADYGADVILLSPLPGAFSFAIETPAGVRIDPGTLGGVAGVKFEQTSDLSVYRLSMPIIANSAPAQAGRWYVVLYIPVIGMREYRLSARARSDTANGVPYSVVVHARSSIAFGAHVLQSSYVPGTTMTLRATLTEMDLPITDRARVTAIVLRPDGSSIDLSLPEIEPGVFETAVLAPLVGVYQIHFRAVGRTLRGYRFTREQLRTGLAWRGGDDNPPTGGKTGGTSGGDDCGCPDWAEWLRCLLSDTSFRRLLENQHVDPDALIKCTIALQKPK